MYSAHHDDIQGNSSPSPPERVYRNYQYDPIDEFDEPDYVQDDVYDEPYDARYAQQYDYEEPEHDPRQFNAPSRPMFPPRTQSFQPRQGFAPLQSYRPPPPPSAPQPQLQQPQRGSDPRNAAGIRLNPVSDLPDVYRSIFKFPVFNAVQSTCFPTVVDTNENMVISAPTGSGKTVLFELAIIRMLKELGESFKCVYMAPTKALCAERQRDWSTKFNALGIKCCELTGDTVQFGKGVWGDAKAATIIITTGEKWDSLTRNWSDHGHILSRITLFLVDEVHILNETRGSTLEVVISRMKSRGSAVRFVLVSATVPNIEDIAAWIGNQRLDGPATVFEFGEEFRPCKLTRHVIPVDRGRSENDFQFGHKLDRRLFPALQNHAVGKPILVFVATRKGVTTTANQLMKDYDDAQKTRKKLPWSSPTRCEHVFHEKALNELSKFGIGIHHAGLTTDDRRAVEELYLKGVLRIVVATSTLAVGVNLPAHTVCIKGVYMFQNNASVEYSDLDIMQMLGRAGRPQFDKDGIAIIMCESELESKYRQLVQGKTIVESSLHTNLAEHINSEIGLGTINSVRSAKEWLRGSFLFQRVKKNPAHYALGKNDSQSWEDRIDDMVTQSIEKLRETKLIEEDTSGPAGDALSSTEYGDIMSKFYIRQSTMRLILALPARPTLREILEVISAAEELSETKLRHSEKSVLNKLRRHNDMRFEVKKVDKTADKIFLLLQAVLGGISLNAPEYKTSDSQLGMEAFGIFKHVARIARVIVEVAVVKKLGAQLKFGLEAVRCLTAKAWEDRPVVLKQIESIGDKSIKVLAENGIVTLSKLAAQEPYKIETLLNRRSPFGLEVLACVNEMPQYTVAMKEVEVHSDGGKSAVEVDLQITCGLANDITGGGKAKKQKGRTLMTAIITLTSDNEFVDFRRIPTKALKDRKSFDVTVELTKPSQSVVVWITSETIAGVSISETYKPKIPYKEYPTRDTRPPTAIDLDLAGLEDDPNFWNEDVDAEGNFRDDMSSQPVAPVRDLTQAPVSKNTSADAKVASSAPHKPPQLLPNGKYACNHSCKDKTKCRHMCCRDGLPEPPRAAKKKPTDELVQPPAPASSSKTSTKSTTKAPPKSDAAIQQLEQLHERTNVALKLPRGSRLKLESKEELKRKRASSPFAEDVVGDDVDTERERAPSFTKRRQLPLELANDDDDDLPEAHELLKAVTESQQQQRKKKRMTTPDTTNYSDSEMDSLIRNAPSEMVSQRPKKTNGSGFVAPVSVSVKKPVASRKRKNADPEPEPDVVVVDDDKSVLPPAKKKKKAQFVEIEDSDEDDNAMVVQPPQPLFDKSSDEVENQLLEHDHDSEPFFSNYLDEEDFSYDAAPAATKVVVEEEKPADVGATRDEVEDELVMNDDLAEFDAWINSGAVEIVPA
ncbi:DEAD/DEAH-box DNA helicase [Mycena kentingensis (nom. inval.)]|nr:DEAD/DEAH-box DNA helicase [Mycena kentingensis (nom. inval.)]